MTSVLSSHTSNLPLQGSSLRERSSKLKSFASCNIEIPCERASFGNGKKLSISLGRKGSQITVLVRAVQGSESESNDDKDEDKEERSENEEVNSEFSREDLERMVNDDSKFNGLDLANLIREKYGRSYDVQLIKKEFMGRNFLAMNVMWKYREQRSFPLSEEEYILRLDDVANTLKCWGAVSHIRNSLAKLKERPRIGKAVSIFIDMDESGGRSNEWIYK
ncbi:hypothetical protein LUZ60_007035 [Juncus effusus]|nr:hypothetical protein LUZ60_007035 [Juncus effusus]